MLCCEESDGKLEMATKKQSKLGFKRMINSIGQGYTLITEAELIFID